MNEDHLILNELLDSVEQLRQRRGLNPNRGQPSLVRRLKEDLARFESDVEEGKLNGRARRRRSGELFRRIVSLYPGIWEKKN